MSLDLYLRGGFRTCYCNCGHKHERKEYFDSWNITHNLGSMFEAAGVYQILWHGDGLIAKDQVEKLSAALADMKARPDFYRQFSAPNGWGTYEQAVPWLEKVVAGFKANPEGILECSR